MQPGNQWGGWVVGFGHGGKIVRQSNEQQAQNAAVAAGILPAVEGGILPPGFELAFLTTHESIDSAGLLCVFFAGRDAPALRQARTPAATGKREKSISTARISAATLRQKPCKVRAKRLKLPEPRPPDHADAEDVFGHFHLFISFFVGFSTDGRFTYDT
jgi:hypothetical protein